MVYLDKAPLDENGKKHGEWIGYHFNNQLWYHGTFIHGVEHGLSEFYYEGGRLLRRGYWSMGRMIGYWYDADKKYYYLWLI